MAQQTRKFHRIRDQRTALVRSLAIALIEHESIETTLPKAKAVVPFVEKLVTKSKQGGLHARRQVISRLANETMASKLFDDITPKLQSRHSGYLRVVRTELRRGDNAQMARVSFVDDLQAKPPAPKPEVETKDKATVKAAPKKATAKKPAVKKEAKS